MFTLQLLLQLLDELFPTLPEHLLYIILAQELFTLTDRDRIVLITTVAKVETSLERRETI